MGPLDAEIYQSQPASKITFTQKLVHKMILQRNFYWAKIILHIAAENFDIVSLLLLNTIMLNSLSLVLLFMMSLWMVSLLLVLLLLVLV